MAIVMTNTMTTKTQHENQRMKTSQKPSRMTTMGSWALKVVQVQMQVHVQVLPWVVAVVK